MKSSGLTQEKNFNVPEPIDPHPMFQSGIRVVLVLISAWITICISFSLPGY